MAGISSHRLSAVGTQTRSYDAAGNTTSIGGTERQFVNDAAGRMSQALRNNAMAMNYRYNGKGEQVHRSGGSVNTRIPSGRLPARKPDRGPPDRDGKPDRGPFAAVDIYTMYDETGRWLGDYDATGAPIQQAIWLDELPVGVIAGGQLHYIQADHLGTPRVVIDPQRDVAVWRWELTGEAFGDTAPNQDPDADAVQFVFDMRFPGQRYDAASGLNYNYFRDYEPGTGRYVESDPIGLIGGISMYGYVGGNPSKWSDPKGLVKWDGKVLPGSLGIGAIAGGVFVFDLKSQCVKGKSARVLVRAEAGGLGIGLQVMPKANATAGGISLEDHLPDIHPENFNGLFFTYGAGFNAGPAGYGCSAYQIGSEWAPAVTGLLDCGGGGVGANVSANILLGKSKLIRVLWSDCNECSPIDTPFE